MNLERKLNSGLRKSFVASALAFSTFLFSCGGDSSSPTNPNQPTQQNRAPVITSTCPPIAQENSFYECRIEATDSDGDVLNYSMPKGPSWLSVSHNILFGRAPEVLEDTLYDITIRVSDNKTYTDQSLTLKNVNLYNVHILSSTQLNQLSTVENNRLIFSQPQNFSQGDIVVSGANNKAPKGFLRKVTSLSSDKRTSNTTQGTLEEALKTNSFSIKQTLSPSNITSSRIISGVSSASSSVFNFSYNINNIVLDERFREVVANGKISFDIDYFLDIDFKSPRKALFQIEFSDEVDIRLDSDISFFLPSLKKTIAEFDLGTYIFTPLPPAPPIPIVVTPEIDVFVGIESSKIRPLEIRVNQSATLKPGLLYENGLWKILNDFSNNFDFSLPTIQGDLETEVYGGMGLTIFMYEGLLPGPRGVVSSSLKLEAASPREWGLYGILRAGAVIDMGIFSALIPDFSSQVIDYEKLLAKGDESSLNEKIVFAGVRGSNNVDIFSMDSNGSNTINLTNSSSLWETYPSCSLDGAKVLYSSKIPFSSDDDDIFVMNADGSNQTRLTSSSMNETHPVFSPDGTKIAYTAAYSTGHEQIFVMNFNGTNQQAITTGDYSRWDLRWSPANNNLAFSSNQTPPRNIFTIRSDGANLRRLTNNADNNRYPSWSPDGGKIAFSSSGKILIMNSDGSNQRIISEGYSPSWSPDGNKLVYVLGTDTSAEIWTMNIDGSDKRRITNNNYNDGTPVWCK